jgi:hypothetical protein
MQTELLKCKSWATVVELSVAMAEYIVNFHHLTIRYSSLDMLALTKDKTANGTQPQLT